MKRTLTACVAFTALTLAGCGSLPAVPRPQAPPTPSHITDLMTPMPDPSRPAADTASDAEPSALVAASPVPFGERVRTPAGVRIEVSPPTTDTTEVDREFRSELTTALKGAKEPASVLHFRVVNGSDRPLDTEGVAFYAARNGEVVRAPYGVKNFSKLKKHRFLPPGESMDAYYVVVGAPRGTWAVEVTSLDVASAEEVTWAVFLSDVAPAGPATEMKVRPPSPRPRDLGRPIDGRGHAD